MRYRISLAVEYDYDIASDHARMLLHLLPAAIPGRQAVRAARLEIDPAPDERRDGPDFFANAASWLTYHRPVREVRLRLEATVERHAAPPALDLSPGLAALAREIALEARLDAAAPHHFLGPSPRTAPRPEMTAFARACLAPGMTALQAVAAVGGALHRAMTFDAEATDVTTPPEAAFAARHGVCQDFSHILIACLRGIGIPAGYVSGFLRTRPPPGKPRLEGADAMHAWVRAWCGAETGWVEYDPTNDVFAALDHIAVAVGRDYADVAPVRGTIRTAGGHATRHRVDVVPEDEAGPVARRR